MRNDLSESALTKLIVEFLHHHPSVGVVWRDRQPTSKPGKGTFHKSNGVADVLGILKGGKGFAFEVKVGSNTPTAEQVLFLARVRDAGGMAEVVRSLEDVQMALKGLDRF